MIAYLSLGEIDSMFSGRPDPIQHFCLWLRDSRLVWSILVVASDRPVQRNVTSGDIPDYSNFKALDLLAMALWLG